MMSFRKKYRVSQDLIHYVRRVLTRSYQSFSLQKEGDCYYCSCNLSAKKFHEIIMRARCEKESDKTDVFFVTAQELENPYLYNCLLTGLNQNAKKPVVVMNSPC